MGNLCVCECPDNLFKDDDMVVDKKNNNYYTQSNDADESKGLIKKQISRSKYGNANIQHKSVFSVDQGVSISLNHPFDSVTILEDNNGLIDSPKQSRKSSLSKLNF